ncbi:PPM family protein phosphatase [Burkholderiales bacterium]|nr:PPM family protein phosphatase [Burkholderiales bacterium]
MAERVVLEGLAVTDCGQVRAHNEDAVFLDLEAGLAVLADGMGGYNAGEVASGLAVNLISQGLMSHLPLERPGARGAPAGEPGTAARIIEEQVVLANRGILEAAATQAECAGMGTTAVVALFHWGKICVGHVGDSRLYRWRKGVLEQLTRDHSFLQEQVESGVLTEDEARRSTYRSLLTRALGIDPEIEVEITDSAIDEGDLYLLCSDGLTDMLEAEDLRSIIGQGEAAVADIAAHLVAEANARGGRDNISVILIRVPAGFLQADHWWQRWLPGHS